MEIKSSINQRKHLAFKFYSLYINLSERTLFRNIEQIKIPAKEFDILRILIEKNGDIATKEEILERIWSDSFVEEGNIPVHISKLRKLLGDNKSEPIIETISGKGYRLIPKICDVSKKEWDEICLNELGHIQPQIAENSLTKSIAVLPLQNESNNDDVQYLADGLTESFINSLSSQNELKVMSRNAVFRYKNSLEDVQTIGKALDVETILTGRIRLVSDRLILSIELIKVSDNSQVWGTQVNQQFSDIFEIQEKIILEVSQTLVSQAKYKNVNSEIRNIHGNQESYRLYLKGRFLCGRKRTKSSNENGIACYKESLLSNPMNLYAYAGLIDSYLTIYTDAHIDRNEAISRIEPILKVAETFDLSLAELESAKGNYRLHVDFDFKEAEKCFKLAIRLDPTFIQVRSRYSHLLIYLGKFFEAMNQVEKINSLDHFSPEVNRRIATVYLLMGKTNQARILLQEDVELDSSNFQAYFLLGIIQNLCGNYTEGLYLLQRSFEIENNLELFACIGQTYGYLGRKDLAHKILKQLDLKSKKEYVPSTYKAYIYLALNNLEKVFECLEEAYRKKDCNLVTLKTAPDWISIRKDPRFIDLLKRIGLPAD